MTIATLVRDSVLTITGGHMPQDDSASQTKLGLPAEVRISSGVDECPYCHTRSKRFIRNGTRSRIFLTLLDGTVYKFAAKLSRWKCPICKRSFTEYPDFAMPNKRFTRQDIMAFCKKYLADELATYRDTVSDKGLPLFYPEHDPDPSWWKASKDDDVDSDSVAPSLSHTAVYRWLTTLAKHSNQKRGTEGVSSVAVPVSRRVYPSKFQSEERRRLLERCMLLLRVLPD